MSRYKAIVAADRAQRAAAGARARGRGAGWVSVPGTRPRAGTSNQQLAAAARQRAAREPAGSHARRAWGVVAVAFSTTGSPASARGVLDLVTPGGVRDTARNLLDQLAAEAQGRTAP